MDVENALGKGVDNDRVDILEKSGQNDEVDFVAPQQSYDFAGILAPDVVGNVLDADAETVHATYYAGVGAVCHCDRDIDFARVFKGAGYMFGVCAVA